MKSTLAIACTLLLVEAALAESPYLVEWTREIPGTRSQAIASDGKGNVVTAGFGNLGDGARLDALLTKLDANGTLLWQKKISSTQDDYGWSVAADAFANLYVVGFTEGSLETPPAGEYDAFLAKFDPDGNRLWTRQIGTSGSDRNWALAVDGSGNAYVGGDTEGSLYGANRGGFDATLSKFDPEGLKVWGTQFGDQGFDRINAINLDSQGNLYIAGDTTSSLQPSPPGGSDGFVAKYNTAGQPIWLKQIGTTQADSFWSIAVDTRGQAVILGGHTRGDLNSQNAGEFDAFVMKLDGEGNQVWTNQFGGGADDRANSVALDQDGSIFVAGYARGGLVSPSVGSDAFLAKLSADGDMRWTQQLEAGSSNAAWGVATDGANNVYLTGDFTPFVSKFSVPEPSALTIAAIVWAGGLLRHRHLVQSPDNPAHPRGRRQCQNCQADAGRD